MNLTIIHTRNETNPAMNLAAEEYALNTMDLSHPHVMFYINEPSVIIGKHQITHEEVNMPFIEKNNIHIVRRVSGGGAVYHDHGNLNFSFLTKAKDSVFNDYKAFTKPIINALNNLGVPAELTGRNDIVVDGKKISGNAQYRRGDRALCHGTLLFDSNLESVVSALNVKADKIASKSIKSIRSRVTNIRELLKNEMDVMAFKDYLLDHMAQNVLTLNEYHFSQSDWDAIAELARTKYESWDWNYGKAPEFNIHHQKRFSYGELDVRIHVKQGVIISIKCSGDFFAEHDIAELESLLVDLPYDRVAIQNTLKDVDLSRYCSGLTLDDFLLVVVP